MRRAHTILIAVGTAATVGAAAVAWQLSDGTAGAATTGPAGGTAKVGKRDLVVTEDVGGELGYADERDLTAARTGVVTSLAAEGATVKAGQALYAVGLEPTVLLTGKVPAYRPLNTASSDGVDVEQLEKALRTLGYADGLTVDDHFSAATADAVEEWEEDLGRDDPDGRVELGDVVFAAGSLRVAARKTTLGDQVGTGKPVLTVTATAKVAEVDLDVDKTDLVARGDAVTVRLPDGTETPGKVDRVGTDAQENPADPSAEPTVDMVVTLTEPGDAKRFDSGAVTVTVEQTRDEDVLAVPVTALLALAEGGYALQVPEAGGHRLLAVQVGTVTDEYAAVTGAGVHEGLAVVVPG